MSRNAFFRLGIAVAGATALFLLFGIGALGVIGDGEHDGMYLGVLAVLLIGTVVARLRPRPMAGVLLATAVAQVLVAVVAIARGLHDSPGASIGELLMLTAMYAGLFTVSAWLFWKASEQESRVLVDSRY
jgi:hypothetical protein